MKVKRAAAVGLLKALGFKTTDSGPADKIRAILQQIADLKPDDELEGEEKLDKDQKKLVDGLRKAGDKDEVIELEEDAAAAKGKGKEKEATKGKEAAPAKAAAGKKGGKTSGNKPKGGTTGRGAPVGQKKIGIVQTIIDTLKKATKNKPIPKPGILAVLVKKFGPGTEADKEERTMKSTVASQVPSGLKAEKEIEVKKNDKGYWIEDSKGW